MDKPLVITTKEKSDNAYEESQKYLETHPALYKRIGTLMWAYHQMGTLIPQYEHNFTSGHYFPYSESYTELESSYQLALLGFYKHAFFGLRNVLELGLLSVYWNTDDRSHETIREWLKSNEPTPRREKIWKELMRIENIQKYSKKSNLKNDIESSYNILSNYIHSKGFKFSSRVYSPSNTINFSSAGLHQWIDLTDKTIKVIIIVHLLKYPVGLQPTPIGNKFGLDGPMGGFLDTDEVGRIKEIFDKPTWKILKKISDQDQDAIATAKWVNDRPDLTEKQWEKQIVEHDKFMIDNQGWSEWYEQHKGLYEHAEDKKGLERFEKKAKKLKTWAQKNNFMESRMIRFQKNNKVDF